MENNALPSKLPLNRVPSLLCRNYSMLPWYKLKLELISMMIYPTIYLRYTLLQEG